MKLSLINILIFGLLVVSDNVRMAGIKINDPQSSLKNLKLTVVADDKDAGMKKYRTLNGNDFTVTCENGKIVYMENDWLQDEKGTQPLYSNFKFGKTSLRDIRKAFGTNGFTYVNRNDLTTPTDIIEFNCFEFDNASNEVLVVITKASLTANSTESNISDNLILDAMVIADKGYLDEIWGEQKSFDTNYKKIKP